MCVAKPVVWKPVSRIFVCELSSKMQFFFYTLFSILTNTTYKYTIAPEEYTDTIINNNNDNDTSINRYGIHCRCWPLCVLLDVVIASTAVDL